MNIPRVENAFPDNENNALWMPYTSNRLFRQAPKIYSKAEGMYMYMSDGRKVLDATAGLWCVNAGHGRREIADAVHKQLLQLDYVVPFGFGHEKSFELADRLVEEIAPPGLGKVFFTNSGSESVDTALKIARAYWKLNGQSSKTKYVSRYKAYHGVNFGGVGVSGLKLVRKDFGSSVESIFLRHTLLAENAFSKGLPLNGETLADELLEFIDLYDESNIAAVIVEPVSGAGGIIVPPVGYLHRLREICTANNILLIFDEVITAFGRLGAKTAAERFAVTPDIMICAKGITNGVVPMGAVFVKNEIYDAFVSLHNKSPEISHGYTSSGNPVSCAAALATLDIYKHESIFEQARLKADIWQDAIHHLRGLPYIKDIRNFGLLGSIDFEGQYNVQLTNAEEIAARLLDKGITVRVSGNTIMLSPPLIISDAEINRIFETISLVVKSLKNN